MTACCSTCPSGSRRSRSTDRRPATRCRARCCACCPSGCAQAEADADVDVIILTGTDPAFCAGLDLKELGSTAGNLGGGSGADGSRNSDGVRGPFPKLTKPLIGAVNGVAITGGFELALNCDFLVASEHAKFGDTHSRVGVMPGWGLTVLLPQAIGVRRAREMSFTGNFMLADEALAFGLVNHVVPHAELIPFTRRLAARHHRQRPAGRPPDPRDLRRDHRPTTTAGRSRLATAGPGAAPMFSPDQVAARRKRDPSPRPTAVTVRAGPDPTREQLRARAPQTVQTSGGRRRIDASDGGAVGAEVVADGLGDVEGEDLGAVGVEVEAVVGADVLARRRRGDR